MKKILAIALVAGLTSAASAQVVTGFTGGSRFSSYWGGSGDVVGFRFTARGDAVVTSLGVWFDDGALDSPHEVGLWLNSSMTLLARATVDNTGTLIGDWYYESITPVNIVAGEMYTLGAMYTSTDSDSYVSTPTTVTLDGIENTNGVYPTMANLNFVYPELDSGNLARFGPNMIIEVGGGCHCACTYDTTGGPNCDIFDFLAFQNDFVNNAPCACNYDTTGGASCDIFDFLAFQNDFVNGCP